MYVVEKKSKGEGVELQCPHCSRVWSYKGHQLNYYTSCSQCKYSVHVKNKRVLNVALSKAKVLINRGKSG